MSKTNGITQENPEEITQEDTQKGNKLSSGQVITIEQDPTLRAVGFLQRKLNDCEGLEESERAIELGVSIVTILGSLDGVKILQKLDDEMYLELKEMMRDNLRYSDIEVIERVLPAQFKRA